MIMMCKKEALHIFSILKKYRFNIWFYIYVFLTAWFWKKILILNIIINAFVFIRYVISRPNPLILNKSSICDNVLFKILVSTSNTYGINAFISLAFDIFIRYIVVFLTGFSIKSVYLMFDFFLKFNNWQPSFVNQKIITIHKFVVYFIKNMYKADLHSCTIAHRWFGSINIVVRNGG